MNPPLFYSSAIATVGEFIELNEENAKHIFQVLRMKTGDQVQLTNGQGICATAIINAISKKNCKVLISSETSVPAPVHRITVAISLLKNAGRFEWFLEKAVETGIHSIIPLICHRTERQVFREKRMQAILVSAMLQSKQSWLTELTEPVSFSSFISSAGLRNYHHLYIAHCEAQEKKELSQIVDQQHNNSLILIGPEGDFTLEEINTATASHFQPVQLGTNRLRTETAGLTAAILLRQLGG